MCGVDKCCYFVPLNVACVLLGVFNFMLSMSLTIISIACYFNEQSTSMVGPNEEKPHFVAEFLGIDLKMQTVNIILSVVVIFGLFWMIFSILLVVGTVKNEPSLVLSYFSFGILLTIMWQLSGLLLLLNKCWWLAIIIVILSIINIHYMIVVHTVYEQMQRGKDFSFNRHYSQDEDLLAESFEEDVNA